MELKADGYGRFGIMWRITERAGSFKTWKRVDSTVSWEFIGLFTSEDAAWNSLYGIR